METEVLPPIEVPKDSLTEELINAVVENFILREGTDYGAIEVTLETKMLQVRKQLDHGEIKIVFDPNTESVTLMTKLDFKKWMGPEYSL